MSQVCRDVHLALGLAVLLAVHLPRHGDHHRVLAHTARVGHDGHALAAAVLLGLVGDLVKLVLDVGHILVHVCRDPDAGLVARAGNDGDDTGVLDTFLGLLLHQRGLPGPGK